MEYIIGLVILIVAILIAVQVLIRKHYVFDSHLGEDVVLRTAAGAVGGGETFIDASGALSVPLGRGRIMSVSADGNNAGSRVEIWLSSYDFINANGFHVLAYQGKAKRIMRACGAGS